MQKLKVSFKNCFGISNFEHEFDFTNENFVLIYAPNGMMKSSFAKTFDCIAKNDKKQRPCDRVYTDRVPEYQVLSDGNPIDPAAIFVSNGESELSTDNRITTFLASKDLKQQYDDIYKELGAIKDQFITKLKSVSKSTDCEGEILSTFRSTEDDTVFSCLISIEEQIRKEQKLFEFRYNDVFDKKGNVKKFIEKHEKLIKQYFTDYQNLLNNSRFFKSNTDGVSFGTYQASCLSDSVADEAFFAAKHKITLSNGEEITSSEQLKALIDEEIKKIVNDEKLKDTFNKIDKAIGNNSELRAFKAVIEKDNTIISLLTNYDEFKKIVWYGYIHSIIDDANTLIDTYRAKFETLTELLKKARKENSIWETIVNLYNKRFNVPFIVEIKNKADVILKEETANLVFKYKDATGEPIEQHKDSLLSVLSKGELRAFYILQLLFEIEARKNSDSDSLIILDDIADSFDYKNKYAIIEYLADLHKDTRFKVFLLTHNFDFYRTIDLRLGLGRSVYMAIHDTNGRILLNFGQYRKDVFRHFSLHASEKCMFIGLLPFVRNIIEYSKGDDSTEYKFLTSCLHIKNDSLSITTNDICNIYKSNIHNCSNLSIPFGNENIIDLILDTAETIAGQNPLVDEIFLQNKIVLSIAIRLRTEQYMIDKLKTLMDIDAISSNQTRELATAYKHHYPQDTEQISIFDRVNLMTPENIHVNAFMYEPLIDMSVIHLVNLYNDIKNIKRLNRAS